MKISESESLCVIVEVFFFTVGSEEVLLFIPLLKVNEQ